MRFNLHNVEVVSSVSVGVTVTLPLALLLVLDVGGGTKVEPEGE